VLLSPALLPADAVNGRIVGAVQGAVDGEALMVQRLAALKRSVHAPCCTQAAMHSTLQGCDCLEHASLLRLHSLDVGGRVAGHALLRLAKRIGVAPPPVGFTVMLFMPRGGRMHVAATVPVRVHRTDGGN